MSESQLFEEKGSFAFACLDCSALAWKAANSCCATFCGPRAAFRRTRSDETPNERVLVDAYSSRVEPTHACLKMRLKLRAAGDLVRHITSRRSLMSIHKAPNVCARGGCIEWAKADLCQNTVFGSYVAGRSFRSCGNGPNQSAPFPAPAF